MFVMRWNTAHPPSSLIIELICPCLLRWRLDESGVVCVDDLMVPLNGGSAMREKVERGGMHLCHCNDHVAVVAGVTGSLTHGVNIIDQSVVSPMV